MVSLERYELVVISLL